MHNALTDLYTSLDRIDALANEIVANTAAALADARIRTLHETQQCASVVLLTGYFQAFLKDVVQRFLEGVAASGVAFTALPLAIQNYHFEGGGEFLRRVSKAGRSSSGARFPGTSRIDVAARLHSATGTGSFDIVWEAFAEMDANPWPNVVNDVAKRLGVSKVWTSIDSKAASAARAPGAKVWTESQMRAQLSDLVAKRNECAHTGTVSPIPTAAELLSYVDLLREIGSRFVEVHEDELKRYVPPLPVPPAGAPAPVPPAAPPPAPPAGAGPSGAAPP